MLFHSKYSLYTVYVRPQIEHYHPVTGVLINTTPRLMAEFGQDVGKIEFDNYLEGGRPDTAAAIVGHYFDSEVAADLNGWSPEERESVEAALLRQCQQTPDHCQLVEQLAPPTPEKPWASYDETDHARIADLAESLDLVAEALDYERAVKMRSTVIRKLEDRLRTQQTVDPDVRKALMEEVGA